jgi:predicted DNA-binding transcriptional regulator YafY
MDSAWYLFAHDVHGTDPEPHLYLLSRMRDVRRTGRTFERPGYFDVRQKLAHSIGVVGGEPERLRLRLRGSAMRWFGERLIHQTQEFILNENGSADFTMDVAINPELQRLIMSWGPEAEVVAPAKLRAKVAEAGREMWKLMRTPVSGR